MTLQEAIAHIEETLGPNESWNLSLDVSRCDGEPERPGLTARWRVSHDCIPYLSQPKFGFNTLDEAVMFLTDRFKREKANLKQTLAAMENPPKEVMCEPSTNTTE